MGSRPDLVCLSHLRWGFVFQRPQHLMTRFARDRRVLFVEEPVRDGDAPRVAINGQPSGVLVVEPHVPAALPAAEVDAALRCMLAELFRDLGVRDYVLWYQTPMAIGFARELEPLAIVYDCMDDLAGFRFAPPEIVQREAEVLRRADVVFTGGRSLHEARRDRHPNIHCCPSSVDAAHFGRAREAVDEPADQASIGRPRAGYAGVIDERMDLDLIDAVAAARPAWQFVLVGPVVKIDPATLPQRPNVHVLGGKPYAQLPAYLAHWDVALLPFARNEATRFISPTKTPEYLAAGLPVVSTSIADVVTPYGEQGLARIADAPAAFADAIAGALDEPRGARLARADAFLAGRSWDATWAFMRDQVDAVLARRRAVPAARRTAGPPGAGPGGKHAGSRPGVRP